MVKSLLSGFEKRRSEGVEGVKDVIKELYESSHSWLRVIKVISRGSLGVSV